MKLDNPTIESIVRKIMLDIENENKFLDIKFMNNEYGEEAKKFGLPKQAYEDDAGIDLPTILDKEHINIGLTIYPGDRVMLHTGIAIALPKNYWARIVHRSSTEKRHRLRVIEGVIDAYRNELLIQVHNMNSYPIIIQHGQKLAQLIPVKLSSLKAREVEELPPSERGLKGFGSSS